jgi:hypothetical protein
MLENRGADGWATVECREPAGSDRLPVHRSESPTGYSSTGCSPAEPASASPVTNKLAAPDPARQSNAPPNQPLPRVGLQGCSPGLANILGLRNIGQFCLDKRPSLSHRENDETEPMIAGQTTDHGFPPKLPIEKGLTIPRFN